jgi:hypothetical protein
VSVHFLFGCIYQWADLQKQQQQMTLDHRLEKAHYHERIYDQSIANRTELEGIRQQQVRAQVFLTDCAVTPPIAIA